MEKLSNNFLVQALYIRKYDCSSVLHPIHTSYRFLITRGRAPPTRKRGEEARIVRCRLVGVVTRTFRPLANLRPRRCFPMSASPPDRPSPLFDEKIREERRPTHPTRRPTYRISVDCRSLSLSFFHSLFFLVMKSSIFFTRKITSNIRRREHLIRDWAIEG